VSPAFLVALALVLAGAGVLVGAICAVTGRGDTGGEAAASGGPAAAAPRTDALPSAAPRSSADGRRQDAADAADEDWVDAMAGATGIPARALAAYAGAALVQQERTPDCHLGWNTLAAIGQVESGHGGGDLEPDGVVRPRLVGVALDGDGVAAVPDTDDGRLDGDRIWDRAVGPLQFLPATWAQFGRDGNGDGAADIDSIDDAAVSAAAYLCSSGADLSDEADWVAAISSYNAGARYNNQVADAAEAFASAGIS
jgi:membrane-bound lytic murein transglycosylase B